MYGLCISMAIREMLGIHNFMTWFNLDSLKVAPLMCSHAHLSGASGGPDPKVIATIDSLPVETHPMTQLSVAMLALQKDSKFFKTPGQ